MSDPADASIRVRGGVTRRAGLPLPREIRDDARVSPLGRADVLDRMEFRAGRRHGWVNLLTIAEPRVSGSLVVLEGPDGVGKSTVSRALAQRFTKAGMLTELLTFPGRSPGTLGKLIYDLHHSPDAFGVSAVTPTAKQTLHIAAHLDAIERVIIPRLEAGINVILD